MKPVIIIFFALFIPIFLSGTVFYYPYFPINLSELAGSVAWAIGLIATGASLYSIYLKRGKK